MRVAEETDTVRAVNGSSRKPVEVIEFQGACLAAPTAMLVSETAAAAVALEDLAFDGIRNVPRGRSPRVAGRTRSRLPTRGESLFHHLFDEQVECLLEDCRQVSIRNSVPEQILGPAELVMTRATPGELELERVLGERRNHGPAFLAAHGRWRCEGQNRRRVRRRRRN